MLMKEPHALTAYDEETKQFKDVAHASWREYCYQRFPWIKRFD